MVDQLRCRPWLDGLRGSPPLDIAGLIQAIERLAALGAMLGPKMRSLDINPLFVHVSGARRLAAVLAERIEEALLFLDLATLRTDADVGTVDGMRWRGPTPELAGVCERLNAEALLRRYEKMAERV